MLDRIKEFLAPPVFADEDKNRVAGYLNLLNLTGMVGILIIAVLLFSTAKFFGPRQIATLISIPFVLFQSVLLRKGHVRFVAVNYVIWMWIAGIISTFDTGGVRSVEFSILLIAIFAAGMLISLRSAVILSVLSSIAGFGLAIAQTNGWLPPIPSEVNPVNGWITQSVFLLFMVGLLYPTVNSIQQSLLRTKRSEARLRGIIENTPDIIMETDLTGIITLINRNQDIYLGMQVRDLIHEDGIPNLNKAIESVLKSRGNASLELKSISPGGMLTWVSVRVGSIAQDGNVVSMVANISNISERKLADQALQHYAALLEMMREIDLAILAAHSIEETSLAAVNLIQRVVPCLWAEVTLFDLEKEQSTLLAFCHKDIYQTGRRVPISFETFGLFAIQRLRQGEPYIIEDVLSDSNASGLDNALTMEGLRAWLMLPLISEDKLIGVLRLGRSEPGPFNTDDIRVTKDVSNQLTIAINSSAYYKALQINNANLEQRVRERTVQYEAANRELEAFAYSVSHDLRAPLRRIDGMSAALLEDFQDRLDEQGHHYLERIRNETQRMGHMIEDILQLSRITRVEMKRESVNLTLLAQTILDRLKETENERQVRTMIDPDMIAFGDPNLLEIMLTNLLSNAWKFTGNQTQPVIEFSNTLVSGQPAFFIRDNGAGFDMAHAKNLFGAFQRIHKQSDFPGTGIGLATVQRIIHRHGGKVWAEAKKDQGATFYFTFEEIS